MLVANIAETMKIAVRNHQAGCLQQAEELYRLVLQSDPNLPVALHALGLIAHQMGKYDVAVELIDKAIANDPRVPQFYNTLGLVFEASGKLEEAIDAYRQAVQLKPDYAEAYHNMGIALQSQGRFRLAVQKCRQAVSLKPDYAEAYNTMAFALQMQGQHNEAIENYRRAVALKPDYAEPYNHLGVVLNAQGRYAEAIESYRQAIQVDHDYAEAHWNHALALLLSGRLTEGWKEYEWRRNPNLEMLTYPHLYQMPRWDGSTFVGNRLFVHYEQGLGDTLQFVRYLPMVKARGGTVIFEVRKPLLGILRGFPGVDELVEASFRESPAVKFDFHASLMDMPGIFGTTLETIPAEVPYLHADSARVRYWRDRIAEGPPNAKQRVWGSPGADFKVGIAWSGSSLYERNHVRSCGLRDFAPMAGIDGVKLYGLQKGRPADQMAELAGEIPVVNLGEQFDDFTDTAAAIENLDLIISTDTSVPHLAAAMGKPVWLLLCCAPEWRWLLDRDDSPWYPTMRIFRQRKRGQWGPVFQRVDEELKQVARASGSTSSPP